MLLSSCPPWKSVYTYFWLWKRSELRAWINAVLVQQACTKRGRHAHPSSGVIAGQSIKTAEGGERRGVDVYKWTSGRERHIIVDTLGLVLIVRVHSADVPDGTGG